MLRTDKIIFKRIFIDPSKQEQGEISQYGLNLLLATYRQDPRQIIARTEKHDGSIEDNKLNSRHHKFEKYAHPKNPKKKTQTHNFSYLVPLPIENMYCEICLNKPIKSQRIDLPDRVGDSFLVVDEIIGRGAFSKVKNSKMSYWFDQDDALHLSTLEPPMVRKILDSTLISPDHTREERQKFFETVAKYDKNLIVTKKDDEYDLDATQKNVHAKLREMEMLAGKRYFGDEHFILEERDKLNDEKRTEIAMPHLGPTLADFLSSGEYALLSISDRMKILWSIACEINVFHEKTKFVHHDIKANNIAFDPRTFTVKLMDFGLANPMGQPALTANALWQDAKLSNDSVSHPENDYFSLGMLALLMLLFTKYQHNFFDKLFQMLIPAIFKDDVKKNSPLEIPEPYKHQFANDEALIELMRHMMSLENRKDSKTIIDELEKLYLETKQFEEAEWQFDHLSLNKKFAIARLQLIASCSDQTKDAGLRITGRKILDDIDDLDLKEPTKLPQLIKTMRATKKAIDETTFENLAAFHNESDKLKDKQWGQKLWNATKIFLGVGLLVACTASLFMSLGSSTPVAMFGIAFAASTIATAFVAITDIAACATGIAFIATALGFFEMQNRKAPDPLVQHQAEFERHARRLIPSH